MTAVRKQQTKWVKAQQATAWSTGPKEYVTVDANAIIRTARALFEARLLSPSEACFVAQMEDAADTYRRDFRMTRKQHTWFLKLAKRLNHPVPLKEVAE